MMNRDRERKPLGTKQIILIVAFGVVLYVLLQNPQSVLAALYDFLGVFSPIITGLCIAFILNVPMTALENSVFAFLGRSKHRFWRSLRRPLCIVLTLLIVIGLLVLFLNIILPELISTFETLADELPGYAAKVVDFITRKLDEFNISSDNAPHIEIDWTEVVSSITTFLKDGSVNLIGTATNLTIGIIGGSIDFVFSIVLAMYVLTQKESIGRVIKRGLIAFLPQKTNDEVLRIASLTYTTFANFLSGQVTEAVILGLLVYFGMLIFGFPYASVIAVLMGVMAVIPIIGALISELIGAFLILMVSPIKALLFLVFVLTLQQIEGSFIYPKVVGKKVGIPGIIVLVAVIIGGNLGGVLGALLGVPVAAVLYAIYKEVVEKRLATKKTKNGGSGKDGTDSGAESEEKRKADSKPIS